MTNLKKQSGVAVTFDANELILGKGVVSEPVHTRSLEEARPYLMDRNAVSRRKNLYLMYRDVHNQQDEALFRKHGIRYDITVLFPGTLGGKKGEYIKTIGHTHPAMEVYEVLQGEAVFCLQYTGKKQNDVFYIGATKGEKVLIPSGMGHVTINIGTEPLILADLFSDTVKSDYSLFKKNHGASYWVCAPEFTNEGLTLAKNKRYKDIGDVLIGVPDTLATLGLSKKKSLYISFIEDPKLFNFLTDRKKESQLLKKGSLFVINWQGRLD